MFVSRKESVSGRFQQQARHGDGHKLVIEEPGVAAGMIVRSRDNSSLLWAALGASLGAHLLVALFFPLWIPGSPEELQPVEALSFARLARVQIERPAAAAQPVAIPDTRHKSQKVSFARAKPELAANQGKPQVRPTALNGPTGIAAAAPRHVRARRPAPLYARAPGSTVPISATQSSELQTPNPQASIADRPVPGAGGADRGGVLPLGAAQDPVLDPTVMQRLSKQVSVHVTLRITVGEDGRTKNVAFDPPIDTSVERQIESILADATWDAAVCGGGVSCEGIAVIKL